MTLNQLQYFMSLATRLNFRAVAEKYFITQPTLSRQIAALEEELHVKLFERNKHGVELTTAGKVLQERLPDIYRELMVLLSDTQEAGSMSGNSLSIGILKDQAISPEVLRAVERMKVQMPDVHIHMERATMNDLYSGLLDHRYDVCNALDLDGQYLRNMEFIEFRRESSCIAMSKRYAEAYGGKIGLEEANQLIQRAPMRLVSMEFYDGVSEPIQAVRNNLHLELPEGSCELVRDMDSLPLFIAAGMYVTVTNQSHIMSMDDNVSLVPVEGSKPYRKGLMYNVAENNTIVDRFVNDLL